MQLENIYDGHVVGEIFLGIILKGMLLKDVVKGYYCGNLRGILTREVVGGIPFNKNCKGMLPGR